MIKMTAFEIYKMKEINMVRVADGKNPDLKLVGLLKRKLRLFLMLILKLSM